MAAEVRSKVVKRGGLRHVDQLRNDLDSKYRAQMVIRKSTCTKRILAGVLFCSCQEQLGFFRLERAHGKIIGKHRRQRLVVLEDGKCALHGTAQ